MIDQTLKQIENRVRQTGTLEESKKSDLLELLSTLKNEIGDLQDPEQARSIAAFADLSAHEAMRVEQNPDLLKHALNGLNSTVCDFEEAHPRLVECVNRIAVTLSNLGI